MLTVDALRRVLAHQRRMGMFFQEAVIQLGLLDTAQLAVLEECRRSYILLLGAALVVRGDLTDAELQEALGAFECYKASQELLPRLATQGAQARGDPL
jgi:hypothetical protein